MSAQPGCSFCRIAAGDERAEVVCETDDWVAFFPDTPATAGHTLVIPRIHVPDFMELEAKMGASLMEGLVRVGRAIREALRPDGMNLISSSGEAADQTVFHLHFHIVPRRMGDPIGRIWPPKKRMDEELKEDLAEVIRAACSATAKE